MIPHASISTVAGSGFGEAGRALHNTSGFKIAERRGSAFVVVSDGRALLVAATSGGLVEASRVSNATRLSEVFRALGLAGTVVPFAISISSTFSFLRGVESVLATAATAADRRIPAAHDRGGVTFREGEEILALGGTRARLRVPHAVFVGTALVLGGVLQRALHVALVVESVPAAHGVGDAGNGVSLGGAVSSTEVFNSVPNALSVVVTLFGIGPAVGALLTAVSINPHASRSNIAARDSQELVAVSVTLSSAVIPLAFSIEVASRFDVVVHAALDHTLVIIVVLTHGISLAASGRAARSSAVLEVASLAASTFARLVPHAAVVSGTLRARVVEEFATTSTRITSGVPHAVVIRDAPGFIGESGALAAATTFFTTPFTVVISKAHGFSSLIRAALAAGGVTEVPHTIRVSITREVVGVATERAAHVTRPLNVELPTAVVHGRTLRLLFKIAASVVASGDGGIPHTFSISLAFRFDVILDIALLVAAIASGAEALPFAEIVFLTLLLGDSLVPLSFVGVTRLDALGLVVVPFAVGVGIAGNVVDLTNIFVFAAHSASRVSSVPFAVDVVPAFTIFNNLGALLGALSADFIPNTPVIIAAGSFVGVAVEAATEAEVGVVRLSSTHVFGVAHGVDGFLSLVGVLSGVIASARHFTDLVLGVVQAVEVGITSSSGRLSVGVTTLGAAENFVATIRELGVGDHGLKFTAVVGVRSAEGVVVGVAGAETLVVVGVVLAHVISITAGLVSNHLAASLALVQGRIPHTFRITVAVVLVDVTPLAVLGANISSITPDTHALVLAVTLGVERPAVLLTSRISSIPHAAVVIITNRLFGVFDFASRQTFRTVPSTELISFAITGDVGSSSVGDLFVVVTRVAALEGLRSPLALRVGGTSGRSVVAENTLNVAAVEMPLAHGVDGGCADTLGEKLIAKSRALQGFVVPDAVVVVGTTKFVVGVFELALSAAVVDSPFALVGVASTRVGVREAVAVLEALVTFPEAGAVSHARRGSAVTIFTLASTDVGSSRGVPFAAVVSVTQGRRPLIIATDAADVTLSGVEDTHGIGVAASDVSFFRAAATARRRFEVPHTAVEFTAAVSVVGEVFTVHLTDIVLPVAQGSFSIASRLSVDFSTSSSAATSGVVPHTLLIFDTSSGEFTEGVASEALFVALAVSGVPVARRVRVAARLITFVGVLEALITAATKSGFPGALRILGTVVLRAVAVLALSLASLRLDVPLAKSGVDTVVLLEEIAELVTFSVEDVPHAISLRFAVTFSESTVDAILLAGTINPDAHLGGSTFGDEFVGGERRIFSGELVVTVLHAASLSDGAIPHAPRVSVTSGGGGVLVTTLFAARAGGRIPFALVPRATVRFVAEVAETAAVSLDGIPFASLASVTVSLITNHVARTTAGGTVDSISLIPVAFLIESTSSGVFVSSVGAREVAVFALALASFVGSPFAHAATSLEASSLRVLEITINTALVGVGVPHAAVVGVAAGAIEVGRRTVVNTFILDEGASSVSSTVLFADGEISDVVVAETRVAALLLVDVPLTFGLLIAISFIEVAVRALVDAVALVEFTNFNKLASSFSVDGVALASADVTIIIPLAASVLITRFVSLKAEGTSTAAARQALEAPVVVGFFIAAASIFTGLLIRVEVVGATSVTFDHIDVADGEIIRVPDTFAPGAASCGTSHAFTGEDTLLAGSRPHTIFIRAGSFSVKTFRADGLALGSEGRPVAEGLDVVGLTFGGVGDDGALLVALREFLAPLTHGVTFAGRLSTDLLAVFTAGLSLDVPHAKTITITRVRILVAVVAARLAFGR